MKEIKFYIGSRLWFIHDNPFLLEVTFCDYEHRLRWFTFYHQSLIPHNFSLFETVIVLDLYTPPKFHQVLLTNICELPSFFEHPDYIILILLLDSILNLNKVSFVNDYQVCVKFSQRLILRGSTMNMAMMPVIVSMVVVAVLMPMHMMLVSFIVMVVVTMMVGVVMSAHMCCHETQPKQLILCFFTDIIQMSRGFIIKIVHRQCVTAGRAYRILSFILTTAAARTLHICGLLIKIIFGLKTLTIFNPETSFSRLRGRLSSGI